MELVPFICLLVTCSALRVKEFRCDYKYDPSVDGWLKYQEIPANWYDARLRCHLEGTTLASPLDFELQEAILHTAKQGGGRYKDIHTGINAIISKGDYFSLEGVPLSDIPHIWDNSEPDAKNDDESCLYMTPDGTLGDINCYIPRNYVCYKKHHRNQRVNECGTIDSEYKFYNETGSCYKFHRVPRTYSRAYMACSAEGGYLTVINTQQEVEILKQIFSQNPHSIMIGNFYKDAAYIGFFDWKEPGDWLTIHEESLQKAGYNKWHPAEPNNKTNEYTGAIYRSGLLMDLEGDSVHAFICEKSPSSLLCG